MQGQDEALASTPFDANFMWVAICDVFYTEFQISRHNRDNLVKVFPDLLGAFEWLQVDHVMVCAGASALPWRELFGLMLSSAKLFGKSAAWVSVHLQCVHMRPYPGLFPIPDTLTQTKFKAQHRNCKSRI